VVTRTWPWLKSIGRPSARAGGLGLAEDLLGALDATELGAQRLAQRHRRGVRVRVQLERLPVDIEFRRIGAQQLTPCWKRCLPIQHQGQTTSE
jgi:hypothetical protein